MRVLPAPEPGDAHSVTSRAVRLVFAEGERVLLVDNKRRRHLITLVPGAQFHTHAGMVGHDEIIGSDDGITVRTTKGARLVALRPTLSDYILEMPRGAQVIYPKDIGPIPVSYTHLTLPTNREV